MSEKITETLKSEAINKYRALPFWSWNDELEEEKLVKQIEWLKSAGFGGYFMHARGGLKTEYMGEKWFSCIEACVKAGKRLKMESWAYDENGWPSGFAGGKLLENPDYRDRYLTRERGAFDETAYASYLITKNELIRVKTRTEAENSAKNYPENEGFLNVYLKISVSTADILNEKVVKKFIELTHEEYKKRLGSDFGGKKNSAEACANSAKDADYASGTGYEAGKDCAEGEGLKGFFTDEPQYYLNGQPYTLVLEEYFKNNYGEDIKDGLGLLFEDKSGYREFRYKFWNAMHELMLNSYAKQVYEWCERSGVELTGHYLEESSLFGQMMCCAGITSFYEYEHMVGIDWLGRRTDTPITPRQASSVARQFGKKRVLGEIYAMCGWDVTPKELKIITEWLFVYGVNVICQHLVPYSEHGQRKRDYPAHYSEYNPWVKKDYKSFNDYFARLGFLLGESEEVVSVGLFAPVSSMYFDYKQGVPKEHEADRSYKELATRLGKANIPFHILDEKIMEGHGKVVGKKLVVGNCEYEFVILPRTLTLSENTARLFEEFYAAGGKILFVEGVPEYLRWEKHDYAMKSNTTFAEIAAAQAYTVSDENTEIASAFRRTKDGKEFIFAANISFEKSYTIEYFGKFKSFKMLNLETLEEKVVSKKLTLEAGESCVLFFADEEPNEEKKKRKLDFCASGGQDNGDDDGDNGGKNGNGGNGMFKLENVSDNYMLLDTPRCSKDGKTYGEKTRYMGIFDELLKERYNGELYLKYEFKIKEMPETISFGFEEMNVKELFVNGEKLKNAIFDENEERFYADISKKVKIGLNEAVLKINFFESEKTYYALFGEGVTETLKNCIAYETTIEAGVLKGDFGVYSEKGFKRGKEKNVLISDGDFYIGKRKTEITDTVKDGYPFFAGHMTFVKNFVWNGSGGNDGGKDYGGCVLRLSGRYQLAYVEINGKPVPKSYFGNTADISEFVVNGVNEARITLYSSSRNLLGPHHLKNAEESFLVGPFSWEQQGSWQNGKSFNERESYSFVRFGLFDEDDNVENNEEAPTA